MLDVMEYQTATLECSKFDPSQLCKTATTALSMQNLTDLCTGR